MHIETGLLASPSAVRLVKPVAMLTTLPITLVLTAWQCGLTIVGDVAETSADLAAACNVRVQQIGVGRTTVTPKRNEDPADVIPLSRDRRRRPKRGR